MPNEVKAQNTIDLTSLKDLNDTVVSTDQYFWHTTNDTGFGAGTHITQKPQQEVLQDPTNAGGNLLATSDGLTLRNGTDMLSEFTKDGLSIDLTNSNAAAGLDFALKYGAYASVLATSRDLPVKHASLEINAQSDNSADVSIIAAGETRNSQMHLQSISGCSFFCGGSHFSFGQDNSRMSWIADGYASSQAFIEVTGDNAAGDVGLGVGSGGENHGVYSFSDSEWLIYKNNASETRAGLNGQINLQTGYDCRNSINACGKVSIQVANINVGTIAANGSKNASVSVTIPTGYIGRAIVGFDMQGTGTASCSLVKLYFNQTDEEVVYWIRNFNNSATGTVTLRAFILCTYDD